MYIKRFTLNDMKHTIKTAYQDSGVSALRRRSSAWREKLYIQRYRG